MSYIGVALLIYAVVAITACGVQRQALFPAPPGGRTPQLEGATLHRIPDPSGATVYALHVPAPAGAPTLVHFHGNGEDLADVAFLAREIRVAGLGVYAIEYPGYGLARGAEASEQAIYAAAEAALGHLYGVIGVPRAEIVLQGQSLGSGVAVEMALRGHGRRLVLLSPYTSITDVADHLLPFLPTSMLVRDHFDSSSKAPRVAVPVLILHGSDDDLIPAQMGRTLGGLFPSATVEILEGAHHNDLFAQDPPIVGRIVRFVTAGPDAR
jgi:uncharacterized protein